MSVDQNKLWDVYLSDDGTLDTVFNVSCRTCGALWQERFDSSEGRSEDDTEDQQELADMVEQIYEQMWPGSGACQCGEKP